MGKNTKRSKWWTEQTRTNQGSRRNNTTTVRTHPVDNGNNITVDTGQENEQDMVSETNSVQAEVSEISVQTQESHSSIQTPELQTSVQTLGSEANVHIPQSEASVHIPQPEANVLVSNLQTSAQAPELDTNVNIADLESDVKALALNTTVQSATSQTNVQAPGRKTKANDEQLEQHNQGNVVTQSQNQPMSSGLGLDGNMSQVPFGPEENISSCEQHDELNVSQSCQSIEKGPNNQCYEQPLERNDTANAYCSDSCNATVTETDQERATGQHHYNKSFESAVGGASRKAPSQEMDTRRDGYIRNSQPERHGAGPRTYKLQGKNQQNKSKGKKNKKNAPPQKEAKLKLNFSYGTTLSNRSLPREDTPTNAEKLWVDGRDLSGTHPQESRSPEVSSNYRDPQLNDSQTSWPDLWSRLDDSGNAGQPFGNQFRQHQRDVSQDFVSSRPQELGRIRYPLPGPFSHQGQYELFGGVRQTYNYLSNLLFRARSRLESQNDVLSYEHERTVSQTIPSMASQERLTGSTRNATVTTPLFTDSDQSETNNQEVLDTFEINNLSRSHRRSHLQRYQSKHYGQLTSDQSSQRPTSSPNAAPRECRIDSQPSCLRLHANSRKPDTQNTNRNPYHQSHLNHSNNNKVKGISVVTGNRNLGLCPQQSLQNLPSENRNSFTEGLSSTHSQISVDNQQRGASSTQGMQNQRESLSHFSHDHHSDNVDRNPFQQTVHSTTTHGDKAFETELSITEDANRSSVPQAHVQNSPHEKLSFLDQYRFNPSSFFSTFEQLHHGGVTKKSDDGEDEEQDRDETLSDNNQTLCTNNQEDTPQSVNDQWQLLFEIEYGVHQAQQTQADTTYPRRPLDMHILDPGSFDTPNDDQKMLICMLCLRAYHQARVNWGRTGTCQGRARRISSTPRSEETNCVVEVNSNRGESVQNCNVDSNNSAIVEECSVHDNQLSHTPANMHGTVHRDTGIENNASGLAPAHIPATVAHNTSVLHRTSETVQAHKPITVAHIHSALNHTSGPVPAHIRVEVTPDTSLPYQPSETGPNNASGIPFQQQANPRIPDQFEGPTNMQHNAYQSAAVASLEPTMHSSARDNAPSRNLPRHPPANTNLLPRNSQDYYNSNPNALLRNNQIEGQSHYAPHHYQLQQTTQHQPFPPFTGAPLSTQNTVTSTARLPQSIQTTTAALPNSSMPQAVQMAELAEYNENLLRMGQDLIPPSVQPMAPWFIQPNSLIQASHGLSIPPEQQLQQQNMVRNSATLNATGNYNRNIPSKTRNTAGQNNTNPSQGWLNAGCNNHNITRGILNTAGNNHGHNVPQGMLNAGGSNQNIPQRLSNAGSNNQIIPQGMLNTGGNNHNVHQGMSNARGNNHNFSQGMLTAGANNQYIPQGMLNAGTNNQNVSQGMLNAGGNNYNVLQGMSNAGGNNQYIPPGMLNARGNNHNVPHGSLNAGGNNHNFSQGMLNVGGNNQNIPQGILNAGANNQNVLQGMLNYGGNIYNQYIPRGMLNTGRTNQNVPQAMSKRWRQ